MSTPAELLEQNKNWAKEITQETPDFFEKSAQGQQPKYLWIGCSDSRVPPNQILNLLPGEIFVHRNIANIIAEGDTSSASVLQYAVGVLKVEHIIVAGHYGCGGVAAAATNQPLSGPIDQWLQNIRNTASLNEAQLSELPQDASIDRLCELNVIAQVEQLRKDPTVGAAWEAGQALEIHSWIYQLDKGLLKSLQEPITGN